MSVQWPLVIFTLFVCLTSGLLGGISLLAVKGKGKHLYMPAVICAFASLVIGGIGSFLHLQHWERAFNGFGHITSGITQEMIGCVVIAIVLIVWFFMLRGKKEISAPLAWISLVVAIAMVAVTAHSYWMESRPAWGIGMIVFYLTNGCLLGGVGLWLLSCVVKVREGKGVTVGGVEAATGVGEAATAEAAAGEGEATAAEAAAGEGEAATAEAAAGVGAKVASAETSATDTASDDDIVQTAAKFTFIGAIAQIAGFIVYLIAAAVAHIADLGHYLDPTRMTTTPTHIDNLASFALVGSGAPMFWGALICAAAALACAIVYRRKGGNAVLFAGVAFVVALVASLMFRVLIYQMGYSVFTLF